MYQASRPRPTVATPLGMRPALRHSVRGLLVALILAGTATTHANPYDPWPNGPPKDDTYFPIGVWYQDINWAQDYANAGINTYIYLDGLWRVGGDKDDGLQYLRNAGLKLITDIGEYQNFVADPIIIGWMQQDEPDNAQALPGGGYGPPVTPAEIHARFDAIKAIDSTRPVYLNFGQGVAYDGWVGRGVRTNHPEDYPDYLDGGTDIAAFDIYPANASGVTQDQLWRVAYGSLRLAQWASPSQPTWTHIETTKISSTSGRKPTTTEVRAEVWMAIIHGARGIAYFAHQISPFNSDALREDTAMMAALTTINGEIRDLAPAIYRPAVDGLATLTDLVPDTPFDDTGIPPEVARLGFRVLEFEGYYYLLAVGLRDRTMQATFDFAGFAGATEARVIHENRTVTITDGEFTDTFAGYEAHLYRFENPNNPPRFHIMEHRWTGGEVFLRWTVAPNATYQIQIGSTLSGWSTLPTVYASGDATLALEATLDTLALGYTDACFVRVIRTDAGGG